MKWWGLEYLTYLTLPSLIFMSILSTCVNELYDAKHALTRGILQVFSWTLLASSQTFCLRLSHLQAFLLAFVSSIIPPPRANGTPGRLPAEG